jgi:NAD(P)-dependent dehydrogenase (short-subunit alcohol dehydrogenase family)
MSTFSAESTTDQVLEGISLAGKTAVVTGASSGLGIETARALAAAGASMMVARNPERLEAAAETLRSAVPEGQFDTALADLADLDNIRTGCADILAHCPKIHLLVNNAGVMACPLMRTAQDFEMQFGTNHLGHFLLTGLLLPALQAAAQDSDQECRIVSLSSAGHRYGPVNFEDPNYEHRDYNKWQAYGESKTANALFAVALDERLKDQSIRAYSVHPGVIVTDLGRHMSQQDMEDLIASIPEGQEMDYKSIEQGSATSIWAATSPDMEGRGGLYLEDCQVAERATAPGARGGIQDYAIDPEAANQLWALSEQLVGQTFDI